MNAEETLALYAKGREAWNAWADEMLAERKRLEEAGTWSVSRDFPWEEEKGDTPETVDWLAKARVDFSAHTFSDDADFSGYRFPGTADFSAAVFEGVARFNNAEFNGTASFYNAEFNKTARFENAQFNGTARFNNAEFNGTAWFNNAKFNGNAWFNDAEFKEYANFINAEFNGDANFINAEFNGDANFINAEFNGDANFENAKFNGNAWFDDAEFKEYANFINAEFNRTASFNNAEFKEYANFINAEFNGDANFENAKFNGNASFVQAWFKGFTVFRRVRFSKNANFTAIAVSSAFTLEGARFQTPPDFNQAHFDEAPRLDDAQFSRFVIQSWILRRPVQAVKRWIVTPDRTHRWRELRRLAIQGHDQEREREFFAKETRARRWVYDYPLPLVHHLVAWLARRQFVVHPSRESRLRGNPWPGIVRYWVGLAYQLSSNFGQWILIPVVWWGVAVITWAGLYLRHHLALIRPFEPDMYGFGAVAGVIGRRLLDWGAGLFGFARAAPPDTAGLSCIGTGTGDPIAAAFHISLNKGLLFAGLREGEALKQALTCLYGPQSDGSANVTISVANLAMGQTLVSAVLVFLFLLAVRNMFKIK